MIALRCLSVRYRHKSFCQGFITLAIFIMETKLDHLFLMFHDFQIVELKYNKDILSLIIKIPWGQLWNDYDFKINLELVGCNFIKCIYIFILYLILINNIRIKI